MSITLRARVSYNRVFDPEAFDEDDFVTDTEIPRLKAQEVMLKLTGSVVQ